MNKASTIFILLFLITTITNSQDIEKALDGYNNNRSQEKIFIHFDKEVYAPGQTVWFKAYLFKDGMPSALSTNFFVQMQNNRQDVLDKKVYPVNGAAVIGSIDIPNDIPEGEFNFKAATSNMLLYNADAYIKKIIIRRTPKQSINQSSALSDITFYPEGGNLIDGILTVVGFKAIDSTGLPVDVTGNIINANGVKIPFKTYFNGLGNVQFRPKAGQAYYAEVPINGKILKFNLPVVKSSGINIRVEDEKGGKQFLISRIEKDGNDLNDITLVAQIDGKVVYNNNISFNDYPSVKGHLLTDSLTSGILHFTIFNNKMQPIAERLSFINSREYIKGFDTKIEKENNANNYFIKLNFKDVAPSSISVSVSDADPLQNNDDNIISDLLITRNLCCHIYNPSSYFKLQEDSLSNALDALLLTSTLNHFKWSEVLSENKKTVINNNDHFITISGFIEDAKDKAIVKGGTLNLSLINEDSTLSNYSVPVSAQGSFTIDSLIFFGSGKFYYTYINASGKKRSVKITLDNDVIEERYMAAGKDSSSNNFFTSNTTIKEDPSVKALEDVVVHSKNKKPSEIVNEKYTNGMFRNKGKIVIDNINHPYINRSQNVVKFLEQNLNTVKFQSGIFVNTKNFSMNSMRYWEVGVLLNEMPSTVGQLSGINMEDVALIKFYEAGFPGVSSNTSPGGALAIYLKKSEGAKEVKANEDFFWYKGYSSTKTFTPEPATIDNFNKLRTSYWKPAIYTNGDTTGLTIPFQINSKAKNIKVVVQGFDANGRLIYFENNIINN